MARKRSQSESAAFMIAAKKQWAFVEELLCNPDIRIIFLDGAPGLGKSYAAYTIGRIDNGVFAVTLTPETPASELMGHWMPKANNLVWRDGPFATALRAGARLVINEISHASSDVLSILYPVLESPATARLTLPTNETLVPREGFHVIITDNQPAEHLPLALQDRLECEINITHPHPAALARLDVRLRRAALRSLSLDNDRRVTMRKWMTIGRLQAQMGLERACAAALGVIRGKQVYDALMLAEQPAE